MSPTASEALDRPVTSRRRLTKAEIQELEIVRADIDVEELILHLVKFAKKSVDIRGSCTAADVELTLDGAHKLTVVIRDVDRKLHRSGALDYTIDMKVKGWWWRLQRRNKEGDDLTLDWEPRIVAYMRSHKTKQKASRGRITRAEFIKRLTRAVKKTKIKFISKELHKKQPIGSDEQDRLEKRDPGMASGYRVEIDGSLVSNSIMNNLEKVLTVGADGVKIGGKVVKAPRKVQVATMMCVLQESKGKTSATNGVHVGLFQQDPRYWPATRDPEKDARAWYKRVIPNHKKNPRMALADLVESVQGSGLPQEYAKWRETADDIVSHFSDSGGRLSEERKKAYEFRVQKKENYWGTAIRLAEEVAWRLYTIKDKLYYISEEDLFRAKARMSISEGENGVDYIDYDDDARRGVTECSVKCRMKMWDAPLGTTVWVDDDGPADGKYLVCVLRRSFFSANGEIILRKPMKEKPEPPAEKVSRGGGQDVGDITTKGGARGIVEQAFKIAQDVGGNGIWVASDYRGKNDTVASGAPSDHSGNDSKLAARDIAVKGIDALVGPPSPKLDKAIVAIGDAFGRDYKSGRVGPFQNADSFQWHNYRIQIIWRTPQWGGHMGHIHIGAKWTGHGKPTNETVRGDHGGPGRRPKYGGGHGATP